MAKPTTKQKPAPDWADFEPLGSSDVRSMCGASQGPVGSGKTRFWLTAPEPIAYFGFDIGGVRTMREQPEFKKKDIRVLDFTKTLNFGRMDRGDRVQAAVEAYEKFSNNWNAAIANARTIIWDKEDKVWELIRYAHNEVDSPDPKAFGELNLQYNGYFTDAAAAGINFGVIRGQREKFGKTGRNERTGKITMGFTGEIVVRGQKEVEDWVELILDHRWDAEERVFKSYYDRLAAFQVDIYTFLRAVRAFAAAMGYSEETWRKGVEAEIEDCA